MAQDLSNTAYRVIAALDFSALGDRAVIEAMKACSAQAHAELHVLVVGSDEDGLLRLPGENRHLLTQEEADAIAREHVAKLVHEFESIAQQSALERIAVYVAPGVAAERIVALAAATDAALVVLGTHGRTGITRWVLGSVAEEVVRRAPCTVLVIRPSDFLNGEKLPQIDAPLKPGEHSLKPFEHRPTYHYVRRAQTTSMMPAC